MDPFWDKFQRDADRVIKRLRGEAKLTPLRVLLKRLRPTLEPLNPGDCADHFIGEDAAQKEALRLLQDLGCLAVLGQSDGNRVTFELFSKRQLAYLAEKVDAALRSHDKS